MRLVIWDVIAPIMTSMLGLSLCLYAVTRCVIGNLMRFWQLASWISTSTFITSLCWESRASPSVLIHKATPWQMSFHKCQRSWLKFHSPWLSVPICKLEHRVLRQMLDYWSLGTNLNEVWTKTQKFRYNRINSMMKTALAPLTNIQHQI